MEEILLHSGFQPRLDQKNVMWLQALLRQKTELTTQAERTLGTGSTDCQNGNEFVEFVSLCHFTHVLATSKTSSSR